MKFTLRKFKNKLATFSIAAVSAFLIVAGISSKPVQSVISEVTLTEEQVALAGDSIVSKSFDIAQIPVYSGNPYVEVNDNIPYFTADELTATSFETYYELDELGRCTGAVASIGRDLMPTEERGRIGEVRPTGWHLVKYDIVDGKYLYNRCHLIGYQLTAENANVNNLITGTRYLNVTGMLPFENQVADYIEDTGNHVMYRVTPIFEGDNLLASGVLMEAYSVEDAGTGVSFNVYCYNVQPGIVIDYVTGDSALAKSEGDANSLIQETTSDQSELVWVPTNGGKKYHNNVSCSGMENPKQLTREAAEAQGFDACKKCYE